MEKIRIVCMSGGEVTYYSPHHRKPMKARIIRASGLIKAFLDFFGFGAMALPNHKIVMLDWLVFDDELIRHELAHVEQYDRLGTARFFFRYFALLIRHGYKNHPMEIEARSHEKR
jgi:hypothetical protein